MENKKMTLLGLVDLETLTKIQNSFFEITGIEIFVVEDVEDARPFDIEEPVVMEGQTIGILRAKNETHKNEVAEAVLKNEASILASIAHNNYKLQQLNEEIEKSASLKSDFLANMSHEIRTPMNAVIGMAEMALREELPLAARDYINQIKTSGKSLLTIINDILDFSKIESGKLDIIFSEYDVMSMVNDVSNIILTRIGDKDVELIVDVNPQFPKTLMGDDIRIKQIIINLANNAVKFTKRGQVVLHLDFVQKNDYELELMGYVEDTGIGIKQEDLENLFESFQQVDSKRNRNIEGTGLGLAITKNLLEMMYGKILVESEYGKGSKFAFTLPQRIVSLKPSVEVPGAEQIKVASLVRNIYERNHICSEIVRLGATHYDLNDSDGLEAVRENGISFVFVEFSMFDDKVLHFIEKNHDITFAIVIDIDDIVDFEAENVVVVRKPVYAGNIGAILRHEPVHSFVREDEDFEVDFCAPDAKLLIVDDNAINLTVAEGLLEPLQMQIDTALSGTEALEKISNNHYDMILMDHMMPEMDGVETARIIRENYPDYYGVPIIALTANVVEETRTMFIAEGMNDFVGKPIEMKIIASVIKRWLPAEKKKPIVNQKMVAKKMQTVRPTVLRIGDLDTASALKLLSSEKLFWKVLKDYYDVIDKKIAIIEECMANEDWKNYTVEVHALKSASKQIGAMELSSMAAELEKAGNELDIKLIKANTGAAMERYAGYKSVLGEFFAEEDEEQEKPELPGEVEEVYVDSLEMAVDNLDFDTVEATVEELGKYKMSTESMEYFKRIKEAFNNVDFEACKNIVKEWKGQKK